MQFNPPTVPHSKFHKLPNTLYFKYLVGLRFVIMTVETTLRLSFYIFTISEVESVNKEVKKGSDTTISCVITGIAAKATVSWRTNSGEVSGTNFTPVEGTYSNGKQTSTLTVKGTQVTADTAYTCRVTSGSLPDSGYSDTTVNLNVYGKVQDHTVYSAHCALMQTLRSYKFLK